MAEQRARIVSITFEENGRTIEATPADEETLQRMLDAGHITALNGQCTCGSSDFCDTIAHRRVRCFNVTADRCEWFLTGDVC